MGRVVEWALALPLHGLLGLGTPSLGLTLPASSTISHSYTLFSSHTGGLFSLPTSLDIHFFWSLFRESFLPLSPQSPSLTSFFMVLQVPSPLPEPLQLLVGTSAGCSVQLPLPLYINQLCGLAHFPTLSEPHPLGREPEGATTPWRSQISTGTFLTNRLLMGKGSFSFPLEVRTWVYVL